MNKLSNLMQQGQDYMTALSKIYELNPDILDLYEKGDLPVFTSIIPFLEIPIIGDPHSLVDSFWLCNAVQARTGGCIYYGFSSGDRVALLFVDGNPEKWESDFPKKGNKLRAAIGSKKKRKFVIKDVSVHHWKGILVIDLS